MRFQKWSSDIFLYMQIYDHMKLMIQWKPQFGSSNREQHKVQIEPDSVSKAQSDFRDILVHAMHHGFHQHQKHA